MPTWPKKLYDGSDWHMGRSVGIEECEKSLAVIGWSIKNNTDYYTNDPQICAQWHKLGYNVVPVYIQKEAET